MQVSSKKSQSGGNQAGTWSTFSTASSAIASRNVTWVNFLFLAAFVLQMQHSGAETKQPILIDTAFTQPQKLQLRFRPLGRYAASTFTSHIRIPFNYSSLMHLPSKMDQRLDKFLEDLDIYHFNMADSTLQTIHSTFHVYRQNTREIFKLFEDLLASLPHVHVRQRRQWDVASFVAATAALSLATYNTVQISKLETAIEAQEAKTDLLTDISKLHEAHLHQLQGQMDGIGNEIQVVKLFQEWEVRIERIIAQISSDDAKLRAVIATFERIIITAFNKKLAPGALSVDVLNQIISHVNEIANRNNYHKFVHEPADLYDLEVSFIHRPEEQNIILILHVPFVEADQLLTLYEFVSLPIHFNFSSNISVVPEVGRNDLIAIGDTNSFQTLSSSDLAACKRLGRTFFCEGRTVLKTNIVHDCMGSLFLPTSTLIKANCKFQISDTREKIFSLGNNTWLVYSIGTIATNQVCPKTKSTTPLTIHSGQAITVPSGCHIATMDHLITADETDDMEVHSTWLDWTMSLPELFDHNDAEQITQVATEIRDTYSGEFDASELIKRLDNIQIPFQSKHWLFSSPLLIILMLALGILLTFCIWKKFCAKPPATELLLPTAPPAAAPAQPQVVQQIVQPAMYPQVPDPASVQGIPAGVHFKKSPPKSITIINS